MAHMPHTQLSWFQILRLGKSKSQHIEYSFNDWAGSSNKTLTEDNSWCERFKKSLIYESSYCRTFVCCKLFLQRLSLPRGQIVTTVGGNYKLKVNSKQNMGWHFLMSFFLVSEKQPKLYERIIWSESALSLTDRTMGQKSDTRSFSHQKRKFI